MPAALTVLLLRHAVHARPSGVLWGRKPEVHLGAEGLAQAEALSRALGARAISAVYTSPRERCRETAAPLAGARGLRVEVDAGLDEIDYGAWTGRAFAELDSDPNWTRWNVSRSDAAPPEGEGMHIVQARAYARLADWIDKHSGEIVVAVTHGDIIKALVCHLLGLSLDRIHTFDVDQASITTLLLWSGGGKVVHLNATLPGEEAR